MDGKHEEDIHWPWPSKTELNQLGVFVLNRPPDPPGSQGRGYLFSEVGVRCFFTSRMP